MHRDAVAVTEFADPASEALKTLLAATTGNFRLSGKNSPVLEKVRHRLARNGLTSLGEYLDLLNRGAVGKRELDDLIAELTVGETFFFRHPEHFDVLRDRVLPEVLKRNEASRRLRIWSAGCSNGAEPYSIAILVTSILGNRINDWNVSIVGSDINHSFLAEAKAATYSAWTLRGVPRDQIPAFFEKSGQQWMLREKYRENVQFVRHNIINEEIPSLYKGISAFDIVFCRNVMIYFNGDVNRRLAARIGSVMVDGGWLFVGSTDFNPGLDANFVAGKSAGIVLYRKLPPVARVFGSGEAETVVPHQEPAPADRPPQRPAHPSRCRSVPPRRQTTTLLPRQPPSAAIEADLQAAAHLANSGDWQNAADRCTAILAADPFNATAHYYHALVLRSTGAHAEAEKALRRAIYLDRGFALAHYQLGLARKDAHDIAGCVRAFRNALDALERVADEHPISPCGETTALDLRELAMRHLEILGTRP